MNAHDMPMPLAPRPHGAVDVAGLGESSLDFVSVVDRLSAVALDSKIRAASFDMLPGGQIATALVACARQGFRTRFIGGLGDDAAGAMIRDGLVREGVEVASALRPGIRSRTAVILVERTTGQRAVIEHRDPAHALGDRAFDEASIADARVLLVDATDPPAATRAAQIARRAGIPVIVDVEQSGPGVDELLCHVDVLIAAEGFAEARRYGAAVTIVTRGARGAIGVCGGRQVEVPAPAVDVVDTTGAGDAFRGGFAAAWLRLGPGAGLGTLMEYAAATAALKCEALGAQTGLPDWPSVEDFVTRARRRQSK